VACPAAVKSQQPVVTLDPDGTDEALGDRLRPQRPDWRADDLNVFAAEDGVKVTRSLAIAIPDQIANRCRALG
jgi:hypothetical protein